jgi:hypothetical protein
MLPEIPDASRQTLPPRLIVDCESKSVRCRPRSRFGRVPFQGPDLLLSAYRRSVGAFFPPPVNPYRGASLPLFKCETADLITCACPFKQGSSLGLNGTHCRVQNIPGRAPISKFFPPLTEPQPAIVSSHSLRADARNRHSFPICLAGISPWRAFVRSVFGWILRSFAASVTCCLQMEIQIGDSADRVCRGLTGLLLCYLGIILLVSGWPTIRPQSLDPLPTTRSIIREHALSRRNLVHGSCKSRA